MSELADFVGVIPYSLYQDEPVALIWKHAYTSPLTRADTDLYSELIVRKNDENETCPEAIARLLSKISNGKFIKLSTENVNTNIHQCYKKLLASIKKFHGVAILENNNGYKVYLVPVKFMKTKKVHDAIANNIYYKECHWISFNKLLCAIYETDDIQKMSVINIENYKQNKKKKKLCEYNSCRLSLQFAYMLRNCHFRIIVPMFVELEIKLNQDVMIKKEIKKQEEEKHAIINIKQDKPETFVVRCKKCRCKLFSDLLIIQHSLDVIEAQCSMKMNVCNCIFIDIEDHSAFELLNKMGETSEMEGLLCCFKCKFKVGRFNYYGQQCSCNEWICPSFQVSVSKVDISRKAQIYFQTNESMYFDKNDTNLQDNTEND